MTWSTLLPIFGITVAVFLVVILGMAVGVLMGRRQISGSCGGLGNKKDADGNTSCSLCSNPDNACRDLAKRMRQRSETPEGSTGLPAKSETSASS